MVANVNYVCDASHVLGRYQHVCVEYAIFIYVSRFCFILSLGNY